MLTLSNKAPNSPDKSRGILRGCGIAVALCFTGSHSANPPKSQAHQVSIGTRSISLFAAMGIIL